MDDKEELELWREFKSICNSIEDKNGHDMKPIRISISSCRVLKTERLNNIVKKLGLELNNGR